MDTIQDVLCSRLYINLIYNEREKTTELSKSCDLNLEVALDNPHKHFKIIDSSFPTKKRPDLLVQNTSRTSGPAILLYLFPAPPCDTSKQMQLILFSRQARQLFQVVVHLRIKGFEEICVPCTLCNPSVLFFGGTTALLCW